MNGQVPDKATTPVPKMTADPVADLADAPNPCGITKEPQPGSSKRTGGMLTFILACGIICNIAITAGAESATQIFGLLGEVRRRRHLQYIVYDNACMLAHFVRNQVRKKATSVGSMLANAFFVLDRWHFQNHTACMNPTQAMYTPEVDSSCILGWRT